MKILIANGVNPYAGKSGYYMASQDAIRALSQLGTVTVMAAHNPNIGHPNIPKNIQTRFFAGKRRSLGGRILGLILNKPFAYTEYASSVIANKFMECVDEIDPDVIVFNHLRSCWLLDFLRKSLANHKLIYIAQNAETSAMESICANQSNLITRFYCNMEVQKLARFEKQVLDSVNVCVVLATEDATRLENKYLNNRQGLFRTIPPAVKETEMRGGVPAGAWKIQLAGSFHWKAKRQNAEWFIREVYTLCKHRRSEISFRIVGAGAETLGNFEKKNSGIEIFTDVLNMEPFFHSGLICVVPERQQGGIKLKTIEAAGYGMPIVSSSAGLEGTGLVSGVDCLEANTPNEFVNCIETFIRDPQMAVNHGKAARKRVLEKFSFCKTMSQWANCFEDIELSK